jgi:hypothetical protein
MYNYFEAASSDRLPREGAWPAPWAIGGVREARVAAVKAGCGEVGRCVATGLAAIAAYVSYQMGTHVFEATRAIPPIAASVSNAGYFSFLSVFSALRSTPVVETVINISQSYEMPFINGVSQLFIAGSLVFAASALAAHCSDKATVKKTAKKVGTLVAGAISFCEYSSFSSKVASFPMFASAALGYRVYRAVNTLSPTGRRMVNAFTTMTIGTVGTSIMLCNKIVMPRALDSLALVTPLGFAALGMGAMALYATRKVYHKTAERSRIVNILATVATAAITAYGVAMTAPVVAGVLAPKVAYLVAGRYALEGIQAITLVSTVWGMVKAYRMTRRTSARLLGAVAGVATFTATYVAARSLDAFVPVSLAFFIYQCAMSGGKIGAKVGRFVDGGILWGEGHARNPLVRTLAHIGGAVGRANKAFNRDVPPPAYEEEAPVHQEVPGESYN